MSVLVLVCLLSLRHNSHWTLTFIAFPAWIWTLVGVGRTPFGRATDRGLIFAGAIPCMVVHARYAIRLGLGWQQVWYQILALSTGMFTLSGYLLSTATAALGIRFLTIQSCREETEGNSSTPSMKHKSGSAATL